MHSGTRRTAAAVALAELVPVPLLDTWLQNQARRWLVCSLDSEHDLGLSPEAVAAHADAPITPLRRVALWPLKLVLKKLFIMFSLVSMVREARAVLDLPGAVLE